MKTSYLPFLKSSIYEQSLSMSWSIPYIAPAICPAIAPTVSQSPPMLALTKATSLKLLVCQTVCRAMARASMQQEPTQPGLSSALVREQVKFLSFQFQLRSARARLNVMNFLPYLLHIYSQSSQGSCMLSARYFTLGQLVVKLLQASFRTCLGSAFFRLYREVRISDSSRQHSIAYTPLWVVLLDKPEYIMAVSSYFLKTMGMGASRISEPLPLLNLSPSSQKSSVLRINSSIDIFILPPRPIECLLPPLLSPLKNHSRNKYRICFGQNLYLQQMSESAMQRAMLQSSVHMPTLPARGSSRPFSMASSISLNPSFMIACPDLVQGVNQVEAPKASQMANPTKEAMHRSTYMSYIASIFGSQYFSRFIYQKMEAILMRSLSFWSTMLKTLSMSSQKLRKLWIQVSMYSLLRQPYSSL